MYKYLINVKLSFDMLSFKAATMYLYTVKHMYKNCPFILGVR